LPDTCKGLQDGIRHGRQDRPDAPWCPAAVGRSDGADLDHSRSRAGSRDHHRLEVGKLHCSAKQFPIRCRPWDACAALESLSRSGEWKGPNPSAGLYFHDVDRAIEAQANRSLRQAGLVASFAACCEPWRSPISWRRCAPKPGWACRSETLQPLIEVEDPVLGTFWSSPARRRWKAARFPVRMNYTVSAQPGRQRAAEMSSVQTRYLGLARPQPVTYRWPLAESAAQGDVADSAPEEALGLEHRTASHRPDRAAPWCHAPRFRLASVLREQQEARCRAQLASWKRPIRDPARVTPSDRDHVVIDPSSRERIAEGRSIDRLGESNDVPRRSPVVSSKLRLST